MTANDSPPCVASVVIPAWNEAARIERAIRSVLDQHRSDVEIIVVDDHSTDDTAAIAAACGNVTVIANPGKGVTDALNAGIAAARSEIIVRIDADDWHLPGSLQALINPLLDDPGLDLMGGSADYIDEAGELIDFYAILPTTEHMKLVAMVACPAEHTAVAFRTATVESLGGYSGSGEQGAAEDYDLWIRMLDAGCRMEGTSQVVAMHTVRTDSITVRAYDAQHNKGQALRNDWRRRYAPGLVTFANLRRMGLDVRRRNGDTRQSDMYLFVLGRLVQLSLRDHEFRRAATTTAAGLSLGPHLFVRGMWRVGRGGLRQRSARGWNDTVGVRQIIVGK